MSDHESYGQSFTNEINIAAQDVGSFSEDSENINVVEKNGDKFLIELFRERRFLYDKRNPNFKDTLMKQNAWNKTMIETNCGDFYTPDYCQRRCTSLREQYNRHKKRMENQSRSGSAASNSTFRQLLLYSQLTFLDQVIKRRKTYSNVTKYQSDASLVDENLSGTKTHDSDDVYTSSSDNKENQSAKHKKTIDAKSTYEEVLKHSPNPKREKANETKELEQTFFNMSNRIMSFMETSKTSTADDAFDGIHKSRVQQYPRT